MTGEITLRGRILPIGGLTEKLLAARRVGVKTVIIPRDNVKHLSDISEKVKDGLQIVPVSSLTEAIPHIFRSYEPEKPKPTPPRAAAGKPKPGTKSNPSDTKRKRTGVGLKPAPSSPVIGVTN
jgi:ATP-dependent Lon protease